MMDIEPEVLACISMEAISTAEVMDRLFTQEWEKMTKRGTVFKALCNLEDSGLIVSQKVRIDTTVNPSRYWALPGGSFPKGVDE